jgi:AcrR family transcriptional regulator
MNSPKQNVAQTKRKARNERRRDQTRTEILDTARDVVLGSGLAGFTLSVVADELGLTKPALYYYFDSKEALLFELLLREWVESATEVQTAVEKTESGVDAVEQLMRTVFNRYRDRLEIFVLFFKMGPGGEFEEIIGRADQRTGGFPKKRDPRRFAFTAHMAVIGFLNMKAIAASAKDPLIHSDEDTIEDLCKTFRDAALHGGAK